MNRGHFGNSHLGLETPFLLRAFESATNNLIKSLDCVGVGFFPPMFLSLTALTEEYGTAFEPL